jgi:hypothetical protein
VSTLDVKYFFMVVSGVVVERCSRRASRLREAPKCTLNRAGIRLLPLWFAGSLRLAPPQIGPHC